MTGDEVVCVYQRVQVEDKAIERGVRGFAIVARYDVLKRRLSQMAASQEYLDHLIGEDKVRKIVMDTDKRTREAGDDRISNA